MKTSTLHLSAAVLIILASFSIAYPGTWTTPELVSEVSTPNSEGWPFLSYDGLTLFFARGGDVSYYLQLYQATRLTPSDSFTNVTQISELLDSGHSSSPWVSPDNLHIYYYRTEEGSIWRLKESTRNSVLEPWGAAQNLTELNALGDVINEKLSSDELSIVFNLFQNETIGSIYTANRNNRDSVFTNIRQVSELNTADVRTQFLSADGLTLFFSRNDGGVWHNYSSSRSTITGTFSTPQLLDYWPEGYGLNCFSSDGQTAYLGYNGDIYVSYYSDNSYYVDANNGDDLNNGETSQTAFATIQKAIDTAPDGYTILVNPGIYTEPIDFHGKALTIQGQAGPDGVPVLEAPYAFAVSFMQNEGTDSILKNVVIRNSYMAVFIVGSSPTISNVTIVDNIYGIRAYVGSNPDISSCIFWNNLNEDLSGCISRYSLTDQAGEGNIFNNPLFVDPNSGDYHLKSERGRYWPEHDVWVLDKVSSPAIDAGDPLSDLLCEPMPNGGFINMGAFGGTSQASMNDMPFPAPDFNKDGIVDESDMADLIDQWLAVSGWIQ